MCKETFLPIGVVIGTRQQKFSDYKIIIAMPCYYFSNSWLLRLLYESPPAETRLTVHSWLQIMRPGRNWATKEQNYVWQTGSASDACSGCSYQSLIRLLWDTLGVSSMSVIEAHDIPRAHHGYLLHNTWCSIAKMSIDGV